MNIAVVDGSRVDISSNRDSESCRPKPSMDLRESSSSISSNISS